MILRKNEKLRKCSEVCSNGLRRAFFYFLDPDLTLHTSGVSAQKKFFEHRQKERENQRNKKITAQTKTAQ